MNSRVRTIGLAVGLAISPTQTAAKSPENGYHLSLPDSYYGPSYSTWNFADSVAHGAMSHLFQHQGNDRSYADHFARTSSELDQEAERSRARIEYKSTSGDSAIIAAALAQFKEEFKENPSLRTKTGIRVTLAGEAESVRFNDKYKPTEELKKLLSTPIQLDKRKLPLKALIRIEKTEEGVFILKVKEEYKKDSQTIYQQILESDKPEFALTIEGAITVEIDIPSKGLNNPNQVSVNIRALAKELLTQGRKPISSEPKEVRAQTYEEVKKTTSPKEEVPPEFDLSELLAVKCSGSKRKPLKYVDVFPANKRKVSEENGTIVVSSTARFEGHAKNAEKNLRDYYGDRAIEVTRNGKTVVIKFPKQ